MPLVPMSKLTVHLPTTKDTNPDRSHANLVTLKVTAKSMKTKALTSSKMASSVEASQQQSNQSLRVMSEWKMNTTK
jgi:RNA:NAD 2'-phosphotransferase (TPT1/KptA family)